jgi:hypothetical protein
MASSWQGHKLHACGCRYDRSMLRPDWLYIHG